MLNRIGYDNVGTVEMLNATTIEGVRANIPFLLACLEAARFRAGDAPPGLAAEVRLRPL